MNTPKGLDGRLAAFVVAKKARVLADSAMRADGSMTAVKAVEDALSAENEAAWDVANFLVVERGL